MHSLESGAATLPEKGNLPDSVIKTPELAAVANAHASHRYTQRFSLKQMAAEYRALRANVTRRWLSLKHEEGETAADAAEQLAQFNAAVDWSQASAIALYDDRMQQQQADLKAADQNKNEFLAVLGHELRNPLAPLRTGMDLLQRAREKPELLDKVVPMFERQLSHLSRLVDDLLDFARISRGEVSLQLAPIDVNEAVDTAIEQVSVLIADRQHHLIVELSKSPLTVLADFDRLTQIVANVLVNAAKYMKVGGQITLTSGVEGERATIHITDEGYGIPSESLETIFELFTQIPVHRQKTGGGGLGIGLSLARRLIEMHGGSIKAKSRGIGFGSEFTITLPLHQHETREVVTHDEAVDRQPFVARGVLIVDDNVDAADSVAALLHLSGHDARTAYDGKTALAHVEEFKPEVVFLDLGLPGMDGFEVARKMREIAGAGGIRIFAVTGWSQADDKRRTQEAGFDGHLVKPATSQQMEQILASLDDDSGSQSA